MTTATLVQQQAELMEELHAVLQRHPVGGAFRLLYAPQELDVPAGTVLVQKLNPETGVVELHPRGLSELSNADVMHEVLDPSDQALRYYANQAQASYCAASTRPDGSTGHLYMDI
ncbi:hypothetical protein RKD23_007985 [Streptomyces sp. SAI-170]|uniref:hypothetical protein n=1 Tax=Streptomyces sp. SAI-170 TaxID=3377729 RepID=UPI003C7D1AD0